MKTIQRKVAAAVLGICLSLCSFASKAHAQIPTVGAQTMFTSVANVNETATNVAAVIDVGKQASVAVQLTQTGASSGTANVNWFFTFSVDGVTYDTVGKTVTVALNGTTPVVTLTNLPSFGAQYIKLNYVTNVGAVDCTISAKYLTKISAP